MVTKCNTARPVEARRHELGEDKRSIDCVCRGSLRRSYSKQEERCTYVLAPSLTSDITPT